MDLGLIVRRLSTHGGTERFVHGLTGWLLAAGHRVTVWCAAVDDSVSGADVESLGWLGRGRLVKAARLDAAAQRVPRERYDLVLRFVRSPGADLYRAGGGCHAAYLERASARSRWGPGEAAELRRDRASAETARHIVVNSRLAADDLMSFYGVPAARITVIRNGVDAHRFRPGPPEARSVRPGGLAAEAIPPGAPRLVFLGTGFRRKGLDTALRALTKIPEAHLLVAGRDQNPGKFERIAAELGLAARVHFLGAVHSPELLLPHCDLAVLPTRYDPAANATLEAMACGLPVVSTRFDGSSEVVPDPALVVSDPSDADAVAGAVVHALQSPGLGEACRAAVAGRPASAAFEELTELAARMVGVSPAPGASSPSAPTPRSPGPT